MKTKLIEGNTICELGDVIFIDEFVIISDIELMLGANRYYIKSLTENKTIYVNKQQLLYHCKYRHDDGTTPTINDLIEHYPEMFI